MFHSFIHNMLYSVFVSEHLFRITIGIQQTVECHPHGLVGGHVGNIPILIVEAHHEQNRQPHRLWRVIGKLRPAVILRRGLRLRDQADQDALIEGLLDGTIDMLVTDHAPHSHEEKAKGLEKSAMGVVGLETSFAASYTHLVKKGILPLEKLVELMHTSPMRRFGCGTEIAVGQVADLTVQ